LTVTAVAFVGSPACIYLARRAFVAGHLRMSLFAFGIVIPIVAILAGFFLVIAIRKGLSREDFPLLDPNGHPQWSLSAMVFASVLTSLPFALLHVDQQGHSLGPFLLMILVSLILCTVRLKTRSLAASTLVHACYNFIIFSLALIGTGGFRHFDKM
jgi:membrane protease YdiL (CAAX protease family)